MAQRSIDSILSDEPSVHTLPDGPESETPSEPVAEPTAEPQSASETPAPKADTQANVKPAATAAAQADDDEPIDPGLPEGVKRALAAARGDGRKFRKQWQEAETRVGELAKKADAEALRAAQLEAKLAVYQQMRPQAQAEKPKAPELPDFFGDPDAHLTAREKLLRNEMLAQREAAKQDQFKRDAIRSERRMRREHEDYDEAMAAVMRARGNDTQFWAQLHDDPEPAELVYAEGKKLLRGGVSESEAQLQSKVAELEAKIAAFSGGVPAASETPRSVSQPKPVPKPSIANARGTGNGVPKAYTGPRSTREVFGD